MCKNILSGGINLKMILRQFYILRKGIGLIKQIASQKS
jgi:hypothetical protein